MSITIPILFSQQARAATTIVVNSQVDTTADDGVCTLREAIIAANTDSASGVSAGECAGGSGTDTINFNISGPADFVNGGQNGYTIVPTSGLPDVSSHVIIDGYSQPGAQANTAVAPNPMNTRLLIEIDGSSAGATNALRLIDASDNSEIYGLVINSFSQGDGLSLFADNIVIRGNFIGVNPVGNTAQPNVVGINTNSSDPDAAKNVTVGGLNPADRNLISGNTSGTTGTASYPGTGWVFQGNYLGVAADGLTPIANSTNGGSGILSIDNCDDVIVGGSQPGAINVFGASLGHGIAPHNVNNLTIEGNYIGLGYDGTTVLGNVDVGSVGAGFALTDTTNATIVNNRFAGWKSEGIYIGLGNSDIDIENNTIFNNPGEGIILQSPNMNVADNTVTGSSLDGIIVGSSDNSVLSNTVSNNTGRGINITADDNSVLSNTVSDNTGHGIGISSEGNNVSFNEVYENGQSGVDVFAADNTVSFNEIYENTQSGVSVSASNNSVTSNEIYGNDQSGVSVSASNNSVTSNEIYGNGQSGVSVSASNNSVSANEIYGNDQDGITVSASDNSVLSNTVSNNTGHGISIFADSNSVSSNEVSGNGQNGITVSGSDNSVLSNTVSNNTGYGIGVSDSDNSVSSNTVSGNDQDGINVTASNNPVIGNTVINNTGFGVNIAASQSIVDDNQISNNHGFANLYVGSVGAPIADITITGNKIGTKANGTLDGSYSQNMGILVNGNVSDVVVGGNSPNDGNIIAGNSGNGVSVAQGIITGFGSATPSNITILRNSIFANIPGTIMGFPVQGLGIDHYGITFDGSFIPQSSTGIGPTPNDSSDPDVGPNNYMNFPVLNSATQNNQQLTVNLDLDAADTTDSNGAYRVEFFANDAADTSGYGEGQIYLGSAQVGNGNSQTISITLGNNIDLTGKVLTATTTALNNTTPSGFGATSEFSEALGNIQVIVSPADTNNSNTGSLPATGSNLIDIAMMSMVLLVLGIVATVKSRRRFAYPAQVNM